MKTVFAALAGALGSTLAQWRAVLLLWLVNALVAWALVGPLGDALEATFLHHPEAPTLPTRLEDETYVDFVVTQASALGATEANVSQAALPWIVLWTVLTAGVWARVADRRAHPGLLAACGRYAHRFVWLLLLTLAALWGLRFVNDWLSAWVTSWLGLESSAALLGWTMTAKTLLMLGLVGLVVSAGRFARLRMIHLDERFAPRSWLAALVSILRHLPSIGLGRVLSLWPLVVVFLLYQTVSPRLLADDALLPGLRLPWRMLLVFQGTQLLLQAAFVYRMAVDARLWPIVAPATAPAVARSVLREPEPAGAPAPPPLPVATERGGAGAGVAAALLVVLLVSPARGQERDLGGAAGDVRPELRGEYVLDVRFDPEARTVSADQRATFVNTTAQPVAELWLHLYAAAFSNTHTLWISGGRPEDVLERGAAEGGHLDVRAVRLEDGSDLAAHTTIGAAGSGGVADASLMRVELPTPVPSGGRVTLVIEFVTRFPRVFARMGMTGRHLDGMQWFPKYCAHDEQGWHADPFWNTGEFFADFAAYDVTFRYPEGLELEATGVPDPLQGAGTGTLVKRYRAQDVHDFAFCVDPVAVRHEDVWVDPASGRRVEIVYLCQPYAEPKAGSVLEMVKHCLSRAAEWWVPYPYPRLVVDGLPHDQGGGMEYPMLFTISQRSPTHLDCLNAWIEDPASVTAHEFSHQYFYGILASNEVEEAWLDEGFTSWATVELLEALAPDEGRADALTFVERKLWRDVLNGAHRGRVPWVGDALSLEQVVGWRQSPFRGKTSRARGRWPALLGFSLPEVDELRFAGTSPDRVAWLKRRYASAADVHPLSTASRDFTQGYAPLVYNKSVLVLATLERHVGSEAMRDLMRTYVERFRFRHPTRMDFLSVVSEKTGGRHDALLQQLVETARTVDWAVEDVRCRQLVPLAGFASQQRPGDPVTWIDPAAGDKAKAQPLVQRLWAALFSLPFPGAPAPPAATAEDGAGEVAPEGEPAEWLTRYTVRQRGEVLAPVAIEACFADGTVLRETWDGAGGSRRYEHRTPAELVEVLVDPDGLFALDLDSANNGHRVLPALEVTRTLKEAAHFWTQNHLNAWALAF